MEPIPYLDIIKQGVLLVFFFTFSGVIYWTYGLNSAEELEKQRFLVLEEEGIDG